MPTSPHLHSSAPLRSFGGQATPTPRGGGLTQSEREVRLAKLEHLRKEGVQPYPERFERSHRIADLPLTGELPDLPTAKQGDGQPYAIAGRLMLKREHGKLTFGRVQDWSGQVQVAWGEDVVGAEPYRQLELYDLGDWIGLQGTLCRTQKGEPTLLVQQTTFLGKALRPLPEKWHGLQDQEARYRQRYLDLIMSEETRQRFRLRSQLIERLRQFLLAHYFEEVETPVLGSEASGALARPFTTHHQALDCDFYLRIATETYLKRLIAGGYERVFEVGKDFRNEGLDPSHLQEFTQLEYYAAFWNFRDNMAFTEKLLSAVIGDVFGKLQVSSFGQVFDFTPPYPQVTFRDLLIRDAGIDIDQHQTADSLRQAIREKGISLEQPELAAKLGRGNLVDLLYKRVSRPKLVQPTFLLEHPIDLSPLARRNDQNPKVADRFQLVVNGWEVVNAYSELVDPIDQRQRLTEQASLKAGGDEEAMMMDEDYLLAMEHGLPPISGWGMGIDRFVALLTGQENLKDVVLFPLLKPVGSGSMMN